jgi:hypothetical protein
MFGGLAIGFAYLAKPSAAAKGAPRDAQPAKRSRPRPSAQREGALRGNMRAP